MALVHEANEPLAVSKRGVMHERGACKAGVYDILVRVNFCFRESVCRALIRYWRLIGSVADPQASYSK
jgi:hypothetical protein